MNASLEPAVLDVLRHSAIGSVINRPVNDVLRDMGLPPLPELPPMPPLPELPPLPVIDLSQMFEPLTHLASGFGSGNLAQAAPVAGGPDPQQAIQGVVSTLSTVMQLGMTGLQLASMLWQGQGAAAAGEKAAETQASTAAVAAQGAQQEAVLGQASFNVATGSAAMAATIAKFATEIAAIGPFLVTPAGQAFLLAAATETLAEATAIVAKTRAELTIQTGEMTASGEKVPVPKPPSAGVASAAEAAVSAQTGAAGAANGQQGLQQLMQLMQIAMPLATTGLGAVSQAAGQINPTQVSKQLDDLKKNALKDLKHPALGGHGGGGGGGAHGAGGHGMASAPLQAYGSGARVLGAGAVATPAVSTATAGASFAGGSSAVSSGPSMMPMGAGGAAGAAAKGAAGDAGTAAGTKGELVTAQHGNEVVGDIAGVSVPVVGAADPGAEPPPDKELTL